MVRGKFKLTEIHQSAWAGDGRTLIFQAQYDPDSPEDQKYAQFTPTGRIEMHVDNPAALQQFELGKAYYVDFTPATE